MWFNKRRSIIHAAIENKVFAAGDTKALCELGASSASDVSRALHIATNAESEYGPLHSLDMTGFLVLHFKAHNVPGVLGGVKNFLASDVSHSLMPLLEAVVYMRMGVFPPEILRMEVRGFLNHIMSLRVRNYDSGAIMGIALPYLSIMFNEGTLYETLRDTANEHVRTFSTDTALSFLRVLRVRNDYACLLGQYVPLSPIYISLDRVQPGYTSTGLEFAIEICADNPHCSAWAEKLLFNNDGTPRLPHRRLEKKHLESIRRIAPHSAKEWLDAYHEKFALAHDENEFTF